MLHFYLQMIPVHLTTDRGARSYRKAFGSVGTKPTHPNNKRHKKYEWLQEITFGQKYMTHSGKLHGNYDWFQTLDQKKTLYCKYSRNMRKHVSQNYWINVISSTLSAAPLFARTVNLVCAAPCFTIYWSNVIRGIYNWIDVNPYSFFLSGYFTNTRMYFFSFSFFSWWQIKS